VTALIALVGIVLIGAPGAQAGLTIKGDTAAWEELNAAFKKLTTLSGYRTKNTLTMLQPKSTDTVIAEYVAPDAFHVTSQATWGTSEIVSANGQIRSRDSYSGNTWKCSMAPASPSAEAIDAVQATVDVSREPDTTIDGTPVRTYVWITTYSGPGPSRPLKRTSYVGTETGLPRRTVVVTATGEGIMDYYDYGAKIEITLPPCG
jgi:hypothetical protein